MYQCLAGNWSRRASTSYSPYTPFSLTGIYISSEWSVGVTGRDQSKAGGKLSWGGEYRMARERSNAGSSEYKTNEKYWRDAVTEWKTTPFIDEIFFSKLLKVITMLAKRGFDACAAITILFSFVIFWFNINFLTLIFKNVKCRFKKPEL